MQNKIKQLKETTEEKKNNTQNVKMLGVTENKLRIYPIRKGKASL